MKKIDASTIITTFTFILFVLCLSVPAGADDLEDKISTYTEDPISADSNMGDFGVNTTFKKMDAKSKAKVRERTADKDQKKQTKSSTNMNSVELGAGSVIKGDVIIIDQSKGDKTQISGK